MSLINLLTPVDYNRIHHTDITNLAEAKAFIETLASNGLMFHFEDGPRGHYLGSAARSAPNRG